MVVLEGRKSRVTGVAGDGGVAGMAENGGVARVAGDGGVAGMAGDGGDGGLVAGNVLEMVMEVILKMVVVAGNVFAGDCGRRLSPEFFRRRLSPEMVDYRSEENGDYRSKTDSGWSAYSHHVSNAWQTWLSVNTLMLPFLIMYEYYFTDYVNHAGSTQSVEDSEKSLAFDTDSDDSWKDEAVALKPLEESKGYVTFSLTNGPEYHVSQVADAVVVARYLKATLVIPDIRGSQPGDRRNFGDIYDIEKFVSSLDGVVKVVKTQPSELTSKNLAVLRIPNRVTEDYISENVEPKQGKHKAGHLLPFSEHEKGQERTRQREKLSGMLGHVRNLELQPEVQEVVDSMVERLKTLSRKSDGQFVAVDLRLEMLDNKGCQGSGDSSKKCYDPQEIAMFLKKLGFDKNSAIYLTQSRWDSSLDSMKDIFPKTYTKEGIMPMDKKPKFLGSDASEYEKVIDFYVCSQSDVFVPAISGLFYANVAGKRIGSGKTKILVPANIPPEASASVGNYVSRYVSKKNHMAYSCFC
ncbi:LOW QUALITY PROTEIN: hypothetical protein OSB04_030294 [Centaurea solstitialis]|uniref:O-fucosyltransferase family protein n=1 Tax=Centaurea solstitialis TaxID=347529 RepID=A0AA38W705_9ASTR|nr:LOW QUALITY PROTEIN: hypothetical protein OSB04_030294 [Centaurea solstitialis]